MQSPKAHTFDTVEDSAVGAIHIKTEEVLREVVLQNDRNVYVPKVPVGLASGRWLVRTNRCRDRALFAVLHKTYL